MRVGFDARWYNGSGVGTYVSELLNALAEVEDELEIVVFENPQNPVPGLSGSRISRVPVRSPKYSAAGQFELKSLCESESVDVFHCPFYPAPLFLSCPVVVTIHDLIPFMFRCAPVWKQTLVKMGYRAAAARASQIIAVSATTANDIERILHVARSRISCIHNATSKNWFHPECGPEEARGLMTTYNLRRPYVVSPSAHNWRTKNLAAAIDALAVARRNSGVDFQTVIYGPEDGLRAVAPPERWEELNIRYIGYVPANDLAALFRNAELFITTPFYEGFGLPVLEAMSCGCAVVTSNAGSLAEVAGTGAQSFNPLDIAGMGSAVAQLLVDVTERNQWKQRATARAAEFSWYRAAQETLGVYRSAYASRHGR